MQSGWSDGVHPDRDVTDAICINEQGGYQFRLTPDGPENPPLKNMVGTPLYVYADGQVLARAPEDIEGDVVTQSELALLDQMTDAVIERQYQIRLLQGGMQNAV